MRAVAASLLLLLVPQVAAAESFIAQSTLNSLKNFGLGIAVLFVGWILARVLGNVVFGLLKRTQLDQKLAELLGLGTWLKSKPEDAIERFFSKVVYYLVLLVAIVAALQMAGLSEAAGPIRTFLDSIMAALPLVGKAALILIVAFVIAYALRHVVRLALTKLNVDGRLADASGTDAETKPFSATAGTIVFWLVMLVGIAGVFEALHIEAIATPLRGMLDRVVLMIPAIAVAVLILGVGWILGRLVSVALSNLLSSAGFDRLPAKVGLAKVFETRTASQVVGLTALIIIMLHATIAALDRLGLESLSAPLSRTIDQFWAFIPALAVALVIVALGVIVGRVVRAVVTSVLRGVGFDAFLVKLGVDFGRFKKTPAVVDATGAPAATTARGLETPSEVVGVLVQVAIVLIASIQALGTLGLLRWALMVEAFLAYSYLNVVVALLILAIGFVLGNYLRDLISSKAEDVDAGRRWMGSAARIVVLVFAFTMALEQLNVAPTFVLLSFGLVFGAICLALALAFGLGSRDTAGEIVRKQYAKAKKTPPSL